MNAVETGHPAENAQIQPWLSMVGRDSDDEVSAWLPFGKTSGTPKTDRLTTIPKMDQCIELRPTASWSKLAVG